MRLINADALKRRAITVRFFGKDIMMIPTAEIDDAPTIDAVEVVRCKDCEWSDWYKTLDGEHRCYCMVHGSSGHTDDDYCSYGEREDGEV